MTLGSLPYFPRSPLDQTVLGLLDMNKGVSMFAARRRGKTYFAQYELLPGAENRGYETIYVDLWAREKQPELAILDKLEAVAPKRRLRITSTKMTAGVSASVVKAGAEVTAASDPVESDVITRLTDAFARLSVKKKWLLVIDEFQSLANCKTEGFIASLRTAIQNHPTLKVFFTGSSQRQLSVMLSSHNSPFLGMAMQVTLPDLGMDFIKDRVAVFQQRTGRKLVAKHLFEVFRSLFLVPEYLNQVLSLMIVTGNYDVYDGYEQWRSTMIESGEGSKLWSTLSELDQTVLTRLLLKQRQDEQQQGGKTGGDDYASMFDTAALAWYSKRLPGETITASRIQTALTRLTRLSAVQAGVSRGDYRIAHDGLLVYIEHLHPVKAARARKKTPSKTSKKAAAKRRR